MAKPDTAAARLSSEILLPLLKASGARIAEAVFGPKVIAEWRSLGCGGYIQFREVTKGGDRLKHHPGIVFDPPLVEGEVVEVSLLIPIEWYQTESKLFPRYRRPSDETPAPIAMVHPKPIRAYLDEPLGRSIAKAVFGARCVEMVPVMPDGSPLGLVEFSIVLESGHPKDRDLDTPLMAGEMVDLILRAPDPDAVAIAGARGFKRPPDKHVAMVKYPRIMYPLGLVAARELLREDGWRGGLVPTADIREGSAAILVPPDERGLLKPAFHQRKYDTATTP